MCGIAGFVGAGSATDLAAMCTAIRHRGPDDEGFWIDEGGLARVALGYRRLAVIDIDGGRQPMRTSDGRLTVVFNGEIYNHEELRRELEETGACFRTSHSDTEVLLHGYDRWGEDLPLHLNGMFAFAIYDHEREHLFMARDRFGKKPLYYAQTPDSFIFCSELSALLRHHRLDPEVDRAALKQYFAFGYIPPPLTLYRGIRKLAGGERATYEISKDLLRVDTYWRYRLETGDRFPGTDKDWAQELRLRLSRAVARRMQSDVPLGFFLSGGIDSTAVVGLAREIVGEDQLSTFTIGFTEPSYDESSYARQAATFFGTDHHEKLLDLNGAVDLLPEILERVDEPVADPSFLPTYLVSQFAREHVTVALAGDGGDELFAGYDTFGAMPLARMYHTMIPRKLHTILEGLAHWLPQSDRNLSFDYKLRRALRGLGHAPPYWQASWLGPASLSEISELFGEAVDETDIYPGVEQMWNACESDHFGDRLLEFYANFYLPGDILAKVDRSSMLNSLEVRSPFLDPEVVELCLRLPYAAKHKGGEQKLLLKQAMQFLVPEKILKRRKKGFGIPIPGWLRHLPMPDPERASNLGLDGGLLERMWNEHRSRQADHRGLLWAWLCLDRCLEGSRSIKHA